MKVNVWPWRKDNFNQPVFDGRVTEADVDYFQFVDDTQAEMRFRVSGHNWQSEYVIIRVDTARRSIELLDKRGERAIISTRVN